MLLRGPSGLSLRTGLSANHLDDDDKVAFCCEQTTLRALICKHPKTWSQGGEVATAERVQLFKQLLRRHANANIFAT
eukprot:794526-Amphidinium_carterae.1